MLFYDQICFSMTVNLTGEFVSYIIFFSLEFILKLIFLHNLQVIILYYIFITMIFNKFERSK